MEKDISNCCVVLEPLVKPRQNNMNKKLCTPESQREEKICITPCCVILENLENNKKGVNDKQTISDPKNSLMPCFVKLEDIDRPSEKMNYCKNEELNKRGSKTSNDSTPRPENILKHKSPLQEATPLLKRAKRNIEPVTPHAHIEFSLELKKVINERNILTSKTKSCVFKALDEIKTKNEEERRKYKRDNALLEIINSEIKYVNQLETIINFFMKPTRERRLLKSDDFDTLFGNINTIYRINKELLQELNKGSDNVANAFSKIGPFLKLYSLYAYDFKNCIKVLQNARLLNPQFAKFVESQETRPEVQNKLSALLITPIQRVPRYKLLLINLYQLTKPSDKDFNSLSECLGKIEEAAEHINKVVEDQENMQRLLEFQRCLRSGEPSIIMPGRKLLKEGVLLRIPVGGTHSERMYVVLMSDIIVFSKMKGEEPKVNSLKCSSIFPLGKCKMIEVLDKGCLRIICQEQELVLYHEQFTETKKWIKNIKDAIQNHVNDRKTLRKESSSRRPVKRKDIHEYHEVGLSPGRPLKKRKFGVVEEPIARCNENKTSVSSLFSQPLTPTMNRQACEESPLDNNAEKPTVTKDLYIFGKSNNTNSGFGKFLGGIGSTIKKFLGFRN